MCSCMAVDCLSLAGIAGGGATDIWYQGQFLEQGRLFFPPEDLHYFQEQVGFAGWKCSQFCRFGTAHEGNFHVLSAPQGYFPAQEQAHMWVALVQWLLWLQETVVILFMLLSHQSFFFLIQLRCDILGPGEYWGGKNQPWMHSASRLIFCKSGLIWVCSGVEYFSIPEIKGCVNPKCDHSGQGWLPPCTLSTATSASELCSRQPHPDWALICFFCHR